MSPSEGGFDAEYYDGRSSARRRVKVVRAGDHVHIEGDGVALDVPLAGLRFRPRVGDLPQGIELPDRGLLVAAPDEIAAVLPVPKESGIARRFEKHTGMLWGSILGVVVAFILGWMYGVPWLADKASMALPEGAESELAESTLKTFDRFVLRPSDLHEGRREELRAPFRKLLAARPGVHATLEFRNGGWIGPNAFALPGGTIVVTDQLVKAMDDDDLVMAILAHEVGHVAHRHASRRLLESSLVALGSVLLLGDVSAISGTAATFPTALLHNAYSRDAEREADVFAFALLRQTGRSPRHFAQALSKLEATIVGTKGEGRDVSFLATHPSSKERLRAARDATP